MARTKKVEKRRATSRPAGRTKPKAKKPSAPTPMAVSTYARRRGVSAEAVRKAIAAGRLEASVVLVRGKPKITDAELADQEWEAHTRAKVDAPTPPGADEAAAWDDDDGMDYNEARRRREIEVWRQTRTKRELDELDLAKRRGELVSVEEARAAAVEVFTVVKTKILGVPTRLRQRLAHVDAEDVRVLVELLREALEDLADERP